MPEQIMEEPDSVCRNSGASSGNSVNNQCLSLKNLF